MNRPHAVRDLPLPRHRYALVTEWVLATSVERVWDVLVEPQSWPTWWRYVERVVLLAPGDADGIGAVRRYTWTSRLPYRLTFDMTTTRIERHTAIEGVASGELQGTGRWRLHSDARGAHVRYAWTVATRKRWMNALAPLLAPLFAWNHDQVMAEGARGLARRLGVPLVAHRRLELVAHRRLDADDPSIDAELPKMKDIRNEEDGAGQTLPE